MKRFQRRTSLLVLRAALAASLLCGASLRAQTLEQLQAEAKSKLAKTGIFFRADAPAFLRNANDTYLPIYLEMINGVEKAAHTTGSSVAKYLTREPLGLQGVNIFIKPSGSQRQFAADPLLWGAAKEFTYDARTNGQAMSIPDRMKKTLEVPAAAIDDYLSHHFIGGPFAVLDVKVSFVVAGWPPQDFYLRVRPKAPPLPHLANWYRGDVHYHSTFTDNPAERGYPLDVTKQVAIQVGLDWVILTDHSTDLNPDRYAEELNEVKKLRDGRFIFIRGEEITSASAKQELLTTVHLLAIPSPEDPDQGFPAAGTPSDTVILGGDGSLTSPAVPVQEALSRISAAGGFAFAAHPFDPISPVLRGGSWDMDADFLAPGGKSLSPGLAGLEPFNRATLATADDARDPFCLHRDADPAACFQPDAEANQYARLEKGIKLGWGPLLLKGLQSADASAESPPFKVFLAAGSDAHGDFNYEATMDVVDFLSKPSRGLSGYAEDNAMGKIFTVAYAPEGMGARGENVLRALREGRSVVTNGPLLIAGFDRNSNGSLDDPEDVGIGQHLSSPLDSLPPLQLAWASSEEFGPFESIQLIVGSSHGELAPEKIPISPAQKLASGGLVPVNLQAWLQKSLGNWCYLRLEGRTRNTAGEEFRCYTNAIWLRVASR